MNFGAFAGGLAHGMDSGMRTGKALSDLIKEGKLQDLREKGMAEAEAQRARSVQDMVKEGLPAQPASVPVDTATPKVETQQVSPASVSAASPTASPDSASAATAAQTYTGDANVVVTPLAESPTASPDAAAANAASGTYQAPSVSTQAPSPEAKTVVQPSAAQPTPQQAVAAAGVSKKPNGKYTVNGESFDTREQAVAAAEKAAPSAQDLFMKNAVPKISQAYLANGDPEKAAAWDRYAESHNGKRAIKDWSAAFTAPDLDTAATRFGKYYTDHINDGVDYKGHKMLTKEDGSQVAVVMLKDKATGKTTEMELTREKMLALGGANNPQKLFEQETAKQASAEKMKLDAGLKAQERKAKREDDFAMEDKKSGNAMKLQGAKTDDALTLEGVKSKSTRDLEKFKQDRLDQREGIRSTNESKREREKLSAKIDVAVESLRDAGYDDDMIKRMMPSLIGVDDHKKTTDPKETRRMLVTSMSNDELFKRKNPEEQNKIIDHMLVLAHPDLKENPAGKPSAAIISDKPMAFNKDLPVKYQKGTGKPFHLVDGKYVPIEGTVTPQAGGLPKQ